MTKSFIAQITQAAKEITQSDSFETLSHHTSVSATTLSRWANGTHIEPIENFFELLQILPKSTMLKLLNETLYSTKINIFRKHRVNSADSFLFCTFLGLNTLGTISILKLCAQHPGLKDVSEALAKNLKAETPDDTAVRIFAEPFSSKIQFGMRTGQTSQAFLAIARTIGESQDISAELSYQDQADLEILSYFITQVEIHISTETTLDIIIQTRKNKFQKSQWGKAKEQYLQRADDWILETNLSPTAKLWVRAHIESGGNSTKFLETYKHYIALKNHEIIPKN